MLNKKIWKIFFLNIFWNLNIIEHTTSLMQPRGDYSASVNTFVHFLPKTTPSWFLSDLGIESYGFYSQVAIQNMLTIQSNFLERFNN